MNLIWLDDFLTLASTGNFEFELVAGSLVEASDVKWQVAVEIRLFRNPTVVSHVAEVFWRAVQEAAAQSRLC